MKLLVSALEPSSNLHLKKVLTHLNGVKLSGIFDRNLHPTPPLYDMSSTAVMGFGDIISQIPRLLKARNQMVEAASQADTVLLMDGSGFNLPLAKKIKIRYRHKRIVYYILPQVWASRVGRVKTLERYCDELLGILPFESEYYPSDKVRYVGHPLLDEIDVDYRPEPHVVSFLPGSRPGEIMRLMPHFVQTRKKLGASVEALLVVPPNFSYRQIASYYRGHEHFTIVRNTHKALASSEFAFICSGTATLEAALIGTPFVLAYIAKPIDYFIGKRLINIQEVGLANILMRHMRKGALHKELLQDKVSVENLLEAYSRTDRKTFEKNTTTLRRYLSHGSSQNVAKILQGAL